MAWVNPFLSFPSLSFPFFSSLFYSSISVAIEKNRRKLDLAFSKWGPPGKSSFSGDPQVALGIPN
jgi:uncharacterized membrane protein YoaT (DUF817 family)